MEQNSDKLDVVLEVDGTEFPCCRQILAEHSPYFQAMFSNNFAEKDKHRIEIKEVDPMAMGILLQSIQQGEVVLDSKNCEDLLLVLQAACMLQFTTLQISCVDTITQKWLTNATCLTIMARANLLSLTDLYHRARTLALWEFPNVTKHSRFLELSISELEDYLQDEGLNITDCGEFEVFEAALSWLQEASASRPFGNKELLRVLQSIKFSDISVSDIRTMFLYHAVTENHWITEVLEQILDIKNGKVSCEDKVQYDEIRQATEVSSPLVPKNNISAERNVLLAERCCCILPGDNVSSTSEYEMKTDSSKKESVFSAAKLLLNAAPRKLPLLPCVVGHCFDPPRPYLISFKNNTPVPLLPLTKAQQGPTEPNGYRVVNKGQDLFLLGGEYFWGHSNWNKSVWRYNLWEKTWTFETSLDQSCRHQSVCILGDDIFVIGGFGKHRMITDSVRKYNIASREWVTCAPLPHPVYSAACCVYKDSIYVFGPQVWSYRPELLFQQCYANG